MRSIHIYLLLVVLFLSCGKDNTTPSAQPAKPPASQSGKHFLWCRINDTAKLFRGPSNNVYSKNSVSAGIPTNLLSGNYGAYIYTGEDDRIALFLYTTNEQDHIPSLNKIYHLSYRASEYGSVYANQRTGTLYHVDSTRSTILFTRCDDSVASGYFEFHGYSYAHDTVHITDGLFDIPLK